MTTAASLSARTQAPTLYPHSSISQTQINTATLLGEADDLRRQLQVCKQDINHLTGQLRDIMGSSEPHDVAAHQAMHDYLRARSNAQLALAANNGPQPSRSAELPKLPELASLSVRAQELVGLHDDREMQIALYRRHEVDIFYVEEQLAQADPQAVAPPGHDEAPHSPMSAQDRMAALKTRHAELEAACFHWLDALVAETPTQRQDIDVASAFVKQQLMGGQEVAVSAIWHWMDKLPGFTQLTPGQQNAVRCMAALKVEEGSCWKSAVQIEAHEASMIEEPALRLKLREQLLEKINPVQKACSDLYMRATAQHADHPELILSLQQSWTVRRQSTLVLIRQIRADRKELEQARTPETVATLRARQTKLLTLHRDALSSLRMAKLAMPVDPDQVARLQGTVDMYLKALQTTQSKIDEQWVTASFTAALAPRGQEAAFDVQRMAALKHAHGAQARTLLGVLARLGSAKREMSSTDSDSLDVFTLAMMKASSTNALAWHSVELLPGYPALTGPVKKAAQLVAQSKICYVAVKGLEDEIASLTASSDTKVSS